jgi:energy-converting hydrogenase Eha subunit H
MQIKKGGSNRHYTYGLTIIKKGRKYKMSIRFLIVDKKLEVIKARDKHIREAFRILTEVDLYGSMKAYHMIAYRVNLSVSSIRKICGDKQYTKGR